MDKIKALLEKSGLKPEVADKICESLDQYRTTVREQLETEYAAKVEQAKKVCLDETEAHKRELARRLQIFAETKTAAIESTVAKQSAIRESGALSTLQQISQIVGGMNVDEAINGRTQATIEKLQRQLQEAREKLGEATELANRQTALANKVLERNRKLTTENSVLASEGKGPRQPIREGAGPRTAQRIDNGRRNGRPVTSRPTLTESQDPRPVPQNGPQTTPQRGNGFTVADIASNMDEDLV